MNFGEVLRRIKPSERESKRIQAVAAEIKSVLESLFAEFGAEVMLGGSVAKNTYLKTKDIDFFVRFPKGTKSISDILIKKLGKKFKLKVMHGSRDYVRFEYKGFTIEVVPVLNVKPDEAENTMDVSPYHVEYVKKNLKNYDDVRLLKQFCKANGIYGAESYISGFSGYLLELLIIKYKTFPNLIMNVSTWKPQIIIDIESYYHNKREIRKKFRTPLVVIDPVLKKRNVAASVSEESLSKFILLCRLFSKSPSKKFFFKRKETIDDVRRLSKKRGTKLFVFRKKFKDEDKEKELSKLKRFVHKVKRQLEAHDFDVYSFGFFEDGTFYFEIVNPKLPPVKKIYGPPVWVKQEHFDSFIKKHKKVWVEGSRLVADAKREYTNAKVLLDKLVKGFIP